MKKYIIIAAAAALCLTACNKEGGIADNRTITVEASIGAMTKATYDGNKSAFAAGDSLSLFAWLGENTSIPAKLVVNNVTNKLGEDGKWAPATQMLWDDMTSQHYFMAVSPARTVKSFTADAFVLDPAADKYQQSDLLIATNVTGLVATSNPVSLAFDHAMAKLNVNLTFRNQWTPGNPPVAPNTEAKIKGLEVTAKDHATIDYLKKGVTATGDAAQLAMNKIENAKWTVLMVPQAGFRTITIKLEGNDEWLGGNDTYVFTHTADIPLESGKYTTVNLTVGRDQITLDKDGIIINDWVAGETIDNGEAQVPDLLSLPISFGASSYPIYYHEGDTWADTFDIAENQNLYQAVDARIWALNIYIKLGATDYVLYEGNEELVSSEDPIDPQGDYYFDNAEN
jgi:hypothetical protein